MPNCLVIIAKYYRERKTYDNVFPAEKKLLRGSTNSCDLMARGITTRRRNKGAIMDCCLFSYFLRYGEAKSFSLAACFYINYFMEEAYLSLSLSPSLSVYVR